MLLIKSTTQACFFFPFLLLLRKLSTIFLSDNDINGVILFHSSFRTVVRFGLSFMDSTNFLVEWLWKVQSNSRSVDAASTYKWRQTWRETQATLWLLIEHMILATCEKTSFAIQIDLIHGCLSSSLVGCILSGIGYTIQSTDKRVAIHSVIAE